MSAACHATPPMTLRALRPGPVCHYCRGTQWFITERTEDAHLWVTTAESRSERAEALERLDRIETLSALSRRVLRRGNHYHLLSVV